MENASHAKPADLRDAPMRRAKPFFVPLAASARSAVDGMHLDENPPTDTPSRRDSNAI
ncbi:MAG TPA: hypothetical protein VJQ82_09320 [Terriglobales bacterium]|nr:hypothetical protein [Terriglobales bacterium]